MSGRNRAILIQGIRPGALRGFGQVLLYSGPEPPSGGVSRPPLAVIAPHCTQFDGVTLTVTTPARSPSPPPPTPPLLPSPPATSYTCAGHMRTHISARVRGTPV